MQPFWRSLLIVFVPRLRPLRDDETQELEALVVRRRQVVDMISAEKIG